MMFIRKRPYHLHVIWTNKRPTRANTCLWNTILTTNVSIAHYNPPLHHIWIYLLILCFVSTSDWYWNRDLDTSKQRAASKLMCRQYWKTLHFSFHPPPSIDLLLVFLKWKIFVKETCCTPRLEKFQRISSLTRAPNYNNSQTYNKILVVNSLLKSVAVGQHTNRCVLVCCREKDTPHIPTL